MLAAAHVAVSFGDEPATGPDTEKRFPPLVVPEGFRATLFACDPLVEYPSVIALGPRQGSLFVAHDYMTGLGTEIIRRDEIRLIADTDGDGYADTSTVFAGGFNSIQGLAYFDDTVFAMHAPLLTALRDTDGDGVADERRNLLDGLGLVPEKNPTRLHCANGVTVGHDGWLYLAMGDNGTHVQRPEGDRLVLQGGGILRCRVDGSDLHVFSTGLRNIYDVALDEELNVFVRDNENDGGDYMIRVCHSFFGADHGYPYLYAERPDEALAPLADLGRGSSAGGVCYLESTFPPEFRGNLFFCEWGRAVVRYRLDDPAGSFAPTAEHDFAAGPAEDPYGFKPTDVVVDRDGSLLVSDWCDGQRPKRGRARIYRIAYQGTQAAAAPHPGNDIESLLSALDSPSYHLRLQAQLSLQALGDSRPVLLARMARNELGVRARLHAVWILSQGGRDASRRELFAMAANDEDPRVRAQAIRAIADLADPVLRQGRLNAGRGDAATAARLANLAEQADPRVQRASIVALGRLRWAGAPAWLRDHLHAPDAAIGHAAMQTLRQSDNWPGVLALLDEPDTSAVRPFAVRAVAEQSMGVLVDGLIARCDSETDADRREEYSAVLARVYRRPGAWVYWGYRPAPRPANTEPWERTEMIAAALDRVLSGADPRVRVAALRRMQRENVPARPETLAQWLRGERNPERVDVILTSLAATPVAGMIEGWIRLVGDSTYDDRNRLRALALLLKQLPESAAERLLTLARNVDEGPVLEELLGELGRRPRLSSEKLLVGKLGSDLPGVRAAAITAVASLGLRAAGERVSGLLGDVDVGVRRAAAAAAGPLGAESAVPTLLTLSMDDDPATRAASLTSLRQLRDRSAISAAVTALGHATTQRAAIDYLNDFGGPEQLAALQATAAASRSVDILASAVRAMDQWQSQLMPGSTEFTQVDQAIADAHADCGLLLRWRVLTVARDRVEQIVEQLSKASEPFDRATTHFASGPESRLAVAAGEMPAAESVVAYSDLRLAEPTRLQFSGSGNRSWRVWLNGRLVHRGGPVTGSRIDADRFEAELDAGATRVVVELGARGPTRPRFQLRFRRASSSAEQERLAQFVLRNNGNVARGGEVFRNSEKSLCVKCHRLDGQGGLIGPDLTGIGRRFSRIHLIESILEPGRTIAPSYESVSVALADGRVVTGVRVDETVDTLSLGDELGNTHVIPKSEIEARTAPARSTMPDGLEKRLTDRELLDLVTYLLSH